MTPPRDLGRAQRRAVIGAVVLAAGEASRFGSPKQQLMLAGRPPRRAGELRRGDRRRRGRLRAGDGCAGRALRGVAARDGGVPALRPRGAAGRTEAAVVVLADGPDLVAEAIDRVISAWRGGAGDAIAASYGGVRSHPVLLGRSVWSDIPDEGARELVPEFVHSTTSAHQETWTTPTTSGFGKPERDELRLQLGRHLLAARGLHVHAELGLEAVALPAVRATREMRLGLRVLLGRRARGRDTAA